MKKRFFILSVIVVLFSLIAVFALVSCEKDINKLELVNNKVSYIEKEHLRYESEMFNVLFVRGEREKHFIADGKCVEVSSFSTITLDPIAADLIGKNFSYKIVGESGEATGTLTKNILGITYSTVLDSNINIGKIVKTEITIDEETTEITFTNALENKISAEKAIEYAYNELESALADSFDKNEFKREVYVRYINDTHDRLSPYYWYVSFMADNSDYKSVLINPDNGAPIK